MSIHAAEDGGGAQLSRKLMKQHGGGAYLVEGTLKTCQMDALIACARAT